MRSFKMTARVNVDTIARTLGIGHNAVQEMTVKNQLHGQRYETTEAIQKAVRQCLRMAGTEFYDRGIFKLPERWEKYVQRSGDYVEK
jgi:hypothetical protein